MSFKFYLEASLGILPSPRDYIQGRSLHGGELEIFLSPGAFHWEKAMYDDSLLASFGASLLQVPDPIQGVKLGFF